MICESVGIRWVAEWLYAKRTASITKEKRVLPGYFCPWQGEGRVNVLSLSGRDLDLDLSRAA